MLPALRPSVFQARSELENAVAPTAEEQREHQGSWRPALVLSLAVTAHGGLVTRHLPMKLLGDLEGV